MNSLTIIVHLVSELRLRLRTATVGHLIVATLVGDFLAVGVGYSAWQSRSPLVLGLGLGGSLSLVVGASIACTFLVLDPRRVDAASGRRSPQWPQCRGQQA